jgi:hypothetical protein
LAFGKPNSPASVEFEHPKAVTDRCYSSETFCGGGLGPPFRVLLRRNPAASRNELAAAGGAVASSDGEQRDDGDKHQNNSDHDAKS